MQALPEAIQPPGPTTTPTPSSPVDGSSDAIRVDHNHRSREVDPISSVHLLQTQDSAVEPTIPDASTQNLGTESVGLHPVTLSTPRATPPVEVSSENLMSLTLVQPPELRLSESRLQLGVQLADCAGEDANCQNENLELLREFKQTGQVQIPTPLPPEAGLWRPTTLEISWRSSRATTELLSRVTCLEAPLDPLPVRVFESGSANSLGTASLPVGSTSTLTNSSSVPLASQAETVNSVSPLTLPISGSTLSAPFSYEVTACVLLMEGRSATNLTSMRGTLDSIQRIRIRWQRYTTRPLSDAANSQPRP